MATSRSPPEFRDDGTPAPDHAQRWYRDLKQGVRDATARAAMLTTKDLKEARRPMPTSKHEVEPPSTRANHQAALAAARAAQGRPFPGAPAVPAGAFTLEGSATIGDLLLASAEVWNDLADVEDDHGIAAGYRAMASDLQQYARALDAARSGLGPVC